MAEALDPLLDDFTRQAANTVLQLKAALQTQSHERTTTFKKAAHKLKGAALNLYCCRMVECCLALEQTTPNTPVDSCQLLVSNLESVIDATESAIVEWKSER